MAKPAFPHMFPRDVPLFSAFVLTPDADGFSRWEFDTKVGVPRDPGPTYAPNIRQMAIALSYLRIDALGYKDGAPWIFEVKPSARLSALGQVLAYRYFWEKQNGLAAMMGVITDDISPSTAEIYRAYHVTPYLVQPAGPLKIAQAVAIVNRKSA
jgi:hypothetical protein